ncbi:MAG: bifunctional histidine phosphatase family protein/GNAT family N-acetyltransferase [Evtepia sp.]|uniref:bifunctional histidine phosphatase family protein/GNAT family N-acetyltransferase n=1 Tax=Evtepia sp. TaxID=2773933 RepID=UPI002A75B68A|nr:bifunctional histidine phosphatase family protein/GNAT family N-acetyltransferase [Evtepia sp.]MDY3015056.1 bifunctional histidine phosphatase family protein/GNAT family N-acetyltransferase [Evtepia sp.]
MTTIYLIRHAEAEGNLYRRIHGQYNSLITDNGYRQIQALEERFAKVPIDVVYSSDLFRTMTTARAIYVPKGLELHTRPDLRELSMGEWEDHSWAGIDRTDHERMGLFTTTSPDFRAPGGESFPEVRRRGTAAILDIAAHHDGQTVAVFAHGTLIRNTLAEFLGIGLSEMKKMGHSDNTAVSLLEITDGTVNVVYMDDNSHLTPEISTLARQNWWKKNDQKADVNLWFAPADLDRAEDRDYYLSCRELAWRGVYGTLDRYDGGVFLEDARAAWKQERKSLAVAMVGSRRAGLLQLDPARGAAEKKGHIAFLYLDPDQRRNGVGVQLIGKSVSVYRPMGRDRLGLVCSQANQPALSFYEKYGFRRTGETQGAYGPLYEMEKYIGYEPQGELR